MSPEAFLKANEQNMFICTHYRQPCKMTYAECVRRQDIVKSSKHSEPGFVRHKGGLSYDYSHCLKCKEGRENRKKAKKGKTIPVKTIKPEQTMKARTQIKSDSDTEKLINSLSNIQPHKAASKTEDLGIKNDSEFKQKHEGITWKKCAECGKPFLRGHALDCVWDQKIYCGEGCRRIVENRQKRKQREAKRKVISKFDVIEKSQEVAIKKWENLSKVLSVFIPDVSTMDSIRAAAVKVGEDCYQQAVQDIKGAK